MHEKTLFNRIEENYKKEQNINLEEKKKMLAQIREIHKPMSKTDFDQHIKHINQCKELTFHRKSLEKEDNDMSPNTDRFYQSQWYKTVLNQEKVKEEDL